MRPGLLTCLALLLASPALAAEQIVDAIAAQVGNRIVLYSEVMQLVSPMEEQLRARGGTESDLARLRADGLERVIEARLIEQTVEETELWATEEEVDGAVAAIAQQNGISVAELERSVAAHGMSAEQYRAQIKGEVERRKVVGAFVGARVRVEESEVRELFVERFAEQPDGGTTVHVRQILVPIIAEQGRDKATVCGEVEAARARVAEGEDFRLVASQVSYVARERGGDLGWVHLDESAPWMQEVIGTLEPGQTSDVLELPFGCGLLELVDRRDFEPKQYEDVAVALEEEIFQRKMDEAVSAWLEELRGRTYIERKGFFAEAASLSQPAPSAQGSGEPGLP